MSCLSGTLYIADPADVIQFTSAYNNQYLVERQAAGIVDHICPIPTSSELADPKNVSSSRECYAAAEIIVGFLEEGDWKRTKGKASSSRSHWLDAVLRWFITLMAETLDDLNSYLPNNPKSSRFGPLRANVQSLAATAQSTVDQVEMFLSQHPACCWDDCDLSLKSLQRLTKVAENFASSLTSKEDSAMAQRQLEMTELSIAGSRSAIRRKCNTTSA